jgi:hypothetical protein
VTPCDEYYNDITKTGYDISPPIRLLMATRMFNFKQAIITNRGHITGPLSKHPFLNTFISQLKPLFIHASTIVEACMNNGLSGQYRLLGPLLETLDT